MAIKDQRIKNALLMKHYIADPAHPDFWMRLGKYIPTVTDSSEDVKEDGVAWYDGDGTSSEEITDYIIAMTFEGTYGADDNAMRYLDHIKYDTNNREVLWKIEREDRIETGLANASGIVTGGGEASAFGEFKTTLTRKEKPKVTNLDGETAYVFKHPATNGGTAETQE
ncbi:phage tail tube protein [Globicatella sanguinis]|uniref:phage tail tube protein n=1 Tax=Globicatella sanguinis TaxID=13076 RepID=UPI000825C5DB|nr:hypothetical protein [Globicatella sanguinis]